MLPRDEGVVDKVVVDLSRQIAIDFCVLQGPGEVRVKITHTALCHTDAFTLSGEDAEVCTQHLGAGSC